MKNAKHIVKTVLFCGTLAVFSAVSVFSPKEKGSFYENRRLAVFPVPSVETVLDGTFFSDVETYISDHFACRVPLLRLNVRKELALHNPVVSNTVIAGDTLLPYHGKPRTDYDHENMQTVPVPSRAVLCGTNIRRTSRPAPTRMIPCARTSSPDWMRAALTA